MEAVTAYLGLGSNLGARLANLEKAALWLSLRRPEAIGPEAAHGIGTLTPVGKGTVRPLRASSVYETAPWGYSDQPDFLNCVLEVQTSVPPGCLLEWVKALETKMGRVHSRRYGPRVIDVDILLYGNLTIDRADLQIPHPRLYRRAFVLVPLAELVPDLVHPTKGLTIRELADRVGPAVGVKRRGPPLDLAADDRSDAAV